MAFTPADGETARWRLVDAYIDGEKAAGDLISFKDVQDLLGVDKATAANVVYQVRVHRERAGKPTLITMRGAGWLLARPQNELEEDARRHQRLLGAAEGRVRLLGSLATRRDELTDEERRTLDFRLVQAAAQAGMLGSRKASAAELLAGGSPPAVPIAVPPSQQGKSQNSLCRGNLPFPQIREGRKRGRRRRPPAGIAPWGAAGITGQRGKTA